VAKKTHLCRHCGDPFEPRLGKRGLVDECEKCLAELATSARSKSDRELLINYLQQTKPHSGEGGIIRLLNRARVEVQEAITNKDTSKQKLERLVKEYRLREENP
jgi:hypothetical protein